MAFGRHVAVVMDLEADKAIAEAGKFAAGLKVADEEAKALGHQLDATEREMADLGITSTVTAHEVGKVGDEAAKATTKLEGLDKRLKAAKASAGALSLDFAKTGDISLKKDIRDAERVVRELEKTRRSVLAFAASDVVGSAGTLAAAGITKALDSGLSTAFGQLKGKLMPVLIGAVVAVSPAIGAVIGGAIVGVVGLGGIIGAVASAGKDPRVQAAFHGFASDVSSEFFKGSALVQPTVDALAILSQDFRSLDLDKMFAKAAPAVTILAHGLGDLVKNLMPGFNAVMDDSVPISKTLADGLSKVGTSISNMLITVLSSPGTLEGLADAFTFVAKSIELVGSTLHFLADLYHLVKPLASFLLEPIFKIVGWVGQQIDRGIQTMQAIGDRIANGPTTASIRPDVKRFDELGRVVGDQADIMRQAAAATKAYKDAIDALDQSISDLIDVSLSQWEADLAVKQGMMDLTATLKENGRHWNDNSAAAIANQQAIATQIDTVKRKLAADLAAAGTDQKLRQKAYDDYNHQIALIDALAKSAGATKKQLDDMADTYHINIEIGTQIGQLGDAERALDQAFQHPAHHAGGGSESGMRPYWAGEAGPELILPSGRGQRILTNQQSMAAVGWRGSVSGGGGDRTIRIIVQDTSGRTLRDQLIKDAKNRGKGDDLVSAAYP